MFEFNPMQVGNIPTIAMREEDDEQKVRSMINDIKTHYTMPVAADVVTNRMIAYGIKYNCLSGWLRDLIDREINVC